MATWEALATQLPELLPHAAEITDYLIRCFGRENRPPPRPSTTPEGRATGPRGH
ncbi:hypothetical protein [Streptomyces sp. NPDC001389]|uniref:hypothetical protein n=1 Tax=unclassified Streptomyces TaxID=2593676 RepID=UPI00369602C5